MAVDRIAAGVDREDLAPKSGQVEVADQDVAIGSGPLGRPHHSHRGRGQKWGESGHWIRAWTPRFSRPRAMISRWISEVPSQIRSTRSSRRNRSATLSRR